MIRPTFNLILLLLITAGGFAPAFAASSANGLEYEVTGEGQLIVFIHGSKLDRRMWAPQVARFCGFAKVLTYDLRGLGASDTPTDTYSDAADLATLLHELGASSAIIVGH